MQQPSLPPATLGDYMRRLRRAKHMSLTDLAEQAELSYSHLSRIENDSTMPRAETVVKLAEALDGDLKVMLQLADCLPRAIIDRLRNPEPSATTMFRSAGLRGTQPGLPPPVADAIRSLRLDPAEKDQLLQVLSDLLVLPPHQRTTLATFIHSLREEGDGGPNT
jgi:transcriptional regulator with XRE-family HTH domain